MAARVHSSHSLAIVAKRAEAPPPNAPNFILMHLDDVGYGDFACNQQPGKRTVTPNIDRMAAEGVRLTSFYSTSCVCTPSRAGILTGRYPVRTSMFPRIVGPEHAKGLPQDEVTLASWLRSKGYATMMAGKWHLGHLPPFLPEAHGFDVWTGIPYSHDFCPCPASLTHTSDVVCRDFDPPCPILNGTTIVEQPAVLERITMYYARALTEYIAKRPAGRPFFAYYACHHLHHPQYVAPRLLGASARLGGRPDFLGDAAYEMDLAIGHILDFLRAASLQATTYVILTSDNGAAVPYGASAGSNGVLRCGKGTTWEGGQRVPAVAWGGAVAPGRVVDDIVAGMDVFTTFASLAGVDVPADRVIDGLDLSGLLVPSRPLPAKRNVFIYYSLLGQATAVRVGALKVHFRVQPWLENKNHAPVASCHPPGVDMGVQSPVLVYNVSRDPGETKPLRGPELVSEAEALARRALREHGCDPKTLKGCDASPPMHCIAVGGSTARKIKPFPPAAVLKAFTPWQQTGFLCCRRGHDLVLPRDRAHAPFCLKLDRCIAPVDSGLCDPDGASAHGHEFVYCGSAPCPMPGKDVLPYSTRKCGSCAVPVGNEPDAADLAAAKAPITSMSPSAAALHPVVAPSASTSALGDGWWALILVLVAIRWLMWKCGGAPGTAGRYARVSVS